MKLPQKYRNSDEYDINPHGAEYREDLKDVYPVFRWVCKYEIVEKGSALQPPSNGQQAPTGAEVSPEYRYTGLSLDEDHCDRQFNYIALTKATYLDYADPNSWVCTNAKPKL